MALRAASGNGISRHRRLAHLAIPVMAAASLSVVMAPAAQAADPCAPLTSVIACENSKPGNPPSEWDVDGGGDPSIEGFATDISVNVGQTIDFKIKTDASAYTIDIYRTGYYGGQRGPQGRDGHPVGTFPRPSLRA